MMSGMLNFKCIWSIRDSYLVWYGVLPGLLTSSIMQLSIPFTYPLMSPRDIGLDRSAIASNQGVASFGINI